MSPALLSHARARRLRLRQFAVAALATLGALTVAVPAAQATVTTMSFTDPTGDAGGFDALDLTSGSVTYDDASGSLTASFTTKAPITSYTAGAPFVQIGLGKATSTGCATDAADGTTVGVFYVDAVSIGAGETGYWSVGGSEDTNATGTSTVTDNGNTVTQTPTDAAGALKGKPLTCFMITTISTSTTADPAPADTAVGLVQSGTTTPPTSGSKSNTTPVVVTAPVTTTLLDTDRDGTPDATDKCPAVAGAQKNGCPSMPPALEVRLGAKRVVIDRLVLRTSVTTCPRLVRVHVTAKGKLIGNGLVSTSQFGSYCRVNGVVKTKKTVKAVRVTMAYKGLASIAKSARR